MTVPDAPTPPTTSWPEAAPEPVRGVRAVDGNRAALTLLVVQNLVSGY
ncbi:hypothetical protein ACFSC4_02195 [Deinococcus malanensis]